MSLALVSDPNTDNGVAAIKYVLDSLGSKSKQIGYIGSQPDPLKAYYLPTQQMYSSLGGKLDCYVDMEEGFDEGKLKQLLNCDVIHLSGGDTYRFLKWLNYRDALPLLEQYIKQGAALIGVSAGAMIMTPSVETASLCGDINTVGLQVLSGLSAVPFHFVPHVSYTQTPAIIEQELQALSKDISQVYFCSDNDSLVIDNGNVIEMGEPFRWQKGE